MESDVFLHILNLILDRADDLRSKCFSENQVHKVLHLIGLCLIEEEREGSELKFTKAAGNSFMLEKLQKLVGSQRITSHKDLLTWAISTWQSMVGIKTCENANQNVNEGVSAREESIKDDKEIERYIIFFDFTKFFPFILISRFFFYKKFSEKDWQLKGEKK